MTPEQEARLPAFARRAIEDLRRELERARAAAEEARLTTDPAESLVQLDRFGEGPIGLGREAITFRLGVDADWSQAFVVRPERSARGARGIEVSYQGGALCVVPSASNSIRVRPTEW